MTSAAKEGPSSSDSGSDFDFATLRVLQKLTTDRSGTYSASPKTNVTSLLQAFKPCFGLRSCRSIDLLHASSFDASAPALGRTVQLSFKDPLYNFRRLKKSKNSAFDKLSLKDMKKTLEIIADFLRPGEHGILFCTAQHSGVLHSVFSAHRFTQSDSLFSSSASISRDMFMVSAAPL